MMCPSALQDVYQNHLKSIFWLLDVHDCPEVTNGGDTKMDKILLSL